MTYQMRLNQLKAIYSLNTNLKIFIGMIVIGSVINCLISYFVIRYCSICVIIIWRKRIITNSIVNSLLLPQILITGSKYQTTGTHICTVCIYLETVSVKGVHKTIEQRVR